MNEPKSIMLHFESGTSNKDFEIVLEKSAVAGKWNVVTRNGRHGGTLTRRDVAINVPYDQAIKLYDAKETEKRKEGYLPMAISGYAPQSTPIADSAGKIIGIVPPQTYPQLLNEIEYEQALDLCRNPEYAMQFKKDGRRLLIDYDASHGTFGINKKGLLTECAREIQADLNHLATFGLTSHLLVDGEDVSAFYYVFDLLKYGDIDLRSYGFGQRYDALIRLFHKNYKNVDYVHAYFSTQEKLNAFENASRVVYDDNGLMYSAEEGVVFKRIDAPYTAGKPNSGGDQFKYKFVKEADVIVGESRSGKRSVSMWLNDSTGKLVFVGNTSISVKYEMPPIGSVGQVRYLYANPETNNLFQPRWRGGRTDKYPKECLLNQLIYKPNSQSDED